MRTRANFWVFAAALILLFLGVITAEERLLAMIVPLVTFLVISNLFVPARPDVEVRRTMQTETILEGDEVLVSLSLRNRGETLAFLEVYDTLPIDAEVTEGANHVVMRLGRGESKSIDYRTRVQVRGRYQIGPVVMRNRDPLGMFASENRVHQEDTLVVAPRVEDIRRVKVLPRRTRQRLGQVPSRTPGHGSDFWSIRGYQTGDRFRQINWKASARFDRYLTNEREAERSGDVILVLDIRDEATADFPHSIIDLQVKAVASLAAKLLQERNRVGLVIQRDVLHWVYPAFGRRQMFRIVDALISIRRGGRWPFSQIAWVLKKYFPSRSLLVIVSPLVDEAAAEAVVTLRAHGFDVILLSPSYLEVERSLLEDHPSTDLAYRVLRMRRDGIIASLRRFAQVVDWNPNEPLAQALKEVSPWLRHGP